MRRWELRASEQERAAGEAAMAACRQWPEQQGLVIGSGGSTGGRKWCLQSWSNLKLSAQSCGGWLEGNGIDPSRVRVVSALPSHHISGLMPQVRAQEWGAELLTISPDELKQPEWLWQRKAELNADKREALISLVPTQLKRLMECPFGLQWLKRFRLIWIGGSALSPGLAKKARNAQLQISPCYGATETAAMVCAQNPSSFLAGVEGCGNPLPDVELKVDADTHAISVKTERLSLGWINGARLESFTDTNGWWISGDAGRLSERGLEVDGRIDGAINSGGATIFPERIEAALSNTQGVQSLVVVGVPDQEWGERVLGIIKPENDTNGQTLIKRLSQAAAALTPEERPKKWIIRRDLSRNQEGKWDRNHWRKLAVKSEIEENREPQKEKTYRAGINQ